VSLPRSAFACFNFLSLGRTPAELLGLLEHTCAEAVQHVLGDVDRSHASWQRQRNEPATALSRSVPVLRFEQLARDGSAAAGPDPVLARVLPNVQDYSETMAQATWEVVEGMLDRGAGPQGPVVVLGYVPPYYPGVTNAGMGEAGRGALDLAEHLVRFASETLGQPYTREPFYHIVCDLSYASVQGGDDLERTLFANMPLNGPAYGIPFPAIRANAMPGLNIGPFGKDFHQLTERVHRRDLLETTPKLIQEAIRVVMEQA
jgi:arginine utilization protein RocB